MISIGFKTRIQLIQRKNSEQWYVNFPTQVAEILEFEKGEEFEWLLVDKRTLRLRRVKTGVNDE